jgi:hypothetical protein
MVTGFSPNLFTWGKDEKRTLVHSLFYRRETSGLNTEADMTPVGRTVSAAGVGVSK